MRTIIFAGLAFIVGMQVGTRHKSLAPITPIQYATPTPVPQPDWMRHSDSRLNDPPEKLNDIRWHPPGSRGN